MACRTRRARQVCLLTANEGAIVTFYVTPEEAPYFLGWDFTLIDSGRVVTRIRPKG